MQDKLTDRLERKNGMACLFYQELLDNIDAQTAFSFVAIYKGLP